MKRTIAIAMLAAGLATLTACGDEPTPPSSAAAPQSAPAEKPAEPAEPAPPGDDEFNFSAAAYLAEQAFAAFDATARWENEVLIVAMTGSVDDELEAQVACGIVNGLIDGKYPAQIEFDDGTFTCDG